MIRSSGPSLICVAEGTRQTQNLSSESRDEDGMTPRRALVNNCHVAERSVQELVSDVAEDSLTHV